MNYSISYVNIGAKKKNKEKEIIKKTQGYTVNSKYDGKINLEKKLETAKEA